MAPRLCGRPGVPDCVADEDRLLRPHADLGQSYLDQVRRGFAGLDIPGERRRVDRVLGIQSRPQGAELILAR
jgi:hypothetical protein